MIRGAAWRLATNTASWEGSAKVLRPFVLCRVHGKKMVGTERETRHIRIGIGAGNIVSAVDERKLFTPLIGANHFRGDKPSIQHGQERVKIPRNIGTIPQQPARRPSLH